MTCNSYGNKQYIAVEGLDKTLALAKAIMQAHDCQVLIQLDDADIYIVSWANRYSDNSGEQFVFMDENEYEDWRDYQDAKAGIAEDANTITPMMAANSNLG